VYGLGGGSGGFSPLAAAVEDDVAAPAGEDAGLVFVGFEAEGPADPGNGLRAQVRQRGSLIVVTADAVEWIL
jgi:hypothetical protein